MPFPTSRAEGRSGAESSSAASLRPLSGRESPERTSAGSGSIPCSARAARYPWSRSRLVYVGDGSSDLHVMLHVNRGEGFTIAVSESRPSAPIALA
jgi:hypothetical protein